MSLSRRVRSMLMILVLLAALFLAACGGSPEAPATGPTTAPAAATAASEGEAAEGEAEPAEGEAEPPGPTGTPVITTFGSGQTVLRLWSHQNPTFQQANEVLVKKFVDADPDIQVVYETFEYDAFIQALQTAMPAGTEGDVIEMFGSWVCAYARGGRLEEIPLGQMSYGQASETFFKAPLDGYYCDGKLYGIPHEFNLENGGVLVNPAHFEKAGVPYPPRWATFNDVIRDAKKMTVVEGDTMNVAGFHFVTGDGLPFTFLAMILQQGGSYMSADGKQFNFESPEAKTAAQLIVDLATTEKVVDPVTFNTDSNWVGDAFFAGNVAIGFVGSWAAASGRVEHPDLKFDYVAIPPYFGDQQKYAADAGWGKVVSVNSKNKEAAWKLAMFMANERENALIWNSTTATIPAMKALIDDPGLIQKAPWLQPTFDLLPHGQYLGDLGDRDEVFYEIIYPNLLDAMQGTVSVDDALAAIQEEANAVLADR